LIGGAAAAGRIEAGSRPDRGRIGQGRGLDVEGLDRYRGQRLGRRASSGLPAMTTQSVAAVAAVTIEARWSQLTP